MISKIEESMVREKEDQKKRRKLELDILHEQIKPHFLYNSLESIGYLAFTGEREKSYQMVTVLADYYRLCLSKGDEILTLRKELELTKHYLTIENMRYPDVFTVLYKIEERLLDCCIPKLTLQPLVENAINHGLRPIGQQGQIVIRVFGEVDRVCVTVEDNGIGMSNSTLKIFENGKFDVSQLNFGLRGTIGRLKLYYGEGFDYSILSWPDGGTIVSLFFQKVYLVPYELNSKS